MDNVEREPSLWFLKASSEWVGIFGIGGEADADEWVMNEVGGT